MEPIPLHDKVLQLLSIVLVLCGLVIGVRTVLVDLSVIDTAMGFLWALVCLVFGTAIYTKIKTEEKLNRSDIIDLSELCVNALVNLIESKRE